MATLTANTSAGGYNSFLEVTIQGTGVSTGLGHLEKENAKQFTLGQNYPNPFFNEANIPVQLKQDADLRLEIWDFSGRKLASIERSGLPAGDHVIPIDLQSLGLGPGSYMYQIEVHNASGSFRQCKVMTGLKD